MSRGSVEEARGKVGGSDLRHQTKRHLSPGIPFPSPSVASQYLSATLGKELPHERD